MAGEKGTNKNLYFFAGLAILFIVLGGSNEYFNIMPQTVSFGLVSTGIAIILFGILESAVNVKLKNSPILGKSISASGAAGGFYLIFMLLKTDLISPPPKPALFDIAFSAPLYTGGGDQHISLDTLRFTQANPLSTYSDYPLSPTKFLGALWVEYEVKERQLSGAGDKYMGTFVREISNSFQGNPSEVPRFKMCFKRINVDPIVAKLQCSDGSCNLTEDSRSIEICDQLNAKIDTPWFFSKAHAADSVKKGWVTPSIDTLERQFKESQQTYVAFSISSENLNLPENADSFQYQVSVNSIPIYINGWMKDETTRFLDKEGGFELKFGLQNLDFAGADFGNEWLKLEITYFARGEELRTDVVERSFIALREVDNVGINVGATHYNWGGKQYFGVNDRFEIFFWSSTDSDELVNRRKRFFDEENIELNGNRLVAVIRPPLNENENFGLVLGIVDNYGRVDFTFSENKASEIEQWGSANLTGRRTKVRPETGYDHPLINELNVYELGKKH